MKRREVPARAARSCAGRSHAMSRKSDSSMSSVDSAGRSPSVASIAAADDGLGPCGALKLRSQLTDSHSDLLLEACLALIAVSGTLSVLSGLSGAPQTESMN